MSGISKEEQERIDRFKKTFNEIHKFMEEALHMRQESFGECLDKMLEQDHIRKKDFTFLHDCRELRNFVVHNQDLYMAIPSLPVVEHIEQILHNLIEEPKVYPEFASKVQTVNASDTMYRVMKIIEDTQYTQFPVYDEGKFVNLLTENVLTRWLARHVVRIQEMGFADLRETASDALKLHDDEAHWEFIPRTMTIAAATALFAEQPVLEALLITERGKISEKLLGILTRSDALDMLDGKRDTQIQRRIKIDD